jgi:hypothetical protein
MRLYRHSAARTITGTDLERKKMKSFMRWLLYKLGLAKKWVVTIWEKPVKKDDGLKGKQNDSM